jgi:hypothetical protein
MPCKEPVPTGEECPVCGKVHKDFSSFKQACLWLGIIGAVGLLGYAYFVYFRNRGGGYGYGYDY